MLQKDSLHLLYIYLSTNIHKLLLSMRPQYISNWNSRSSYIMELVQRWWLLSNFFLTPIFFLVSNALSITNSLTACLSDLCVGPINLGTFMYGTHILLLWAFRILDDIALLCIRLIICHPIMFVVIGIIQVVIPVKPMFCFINAFSYPIVITFNTRMLDSSDLAVIQYLSSFSREVLCKHTWWQRWSFWQLKCSCTITLTEWPGWFDDLFHVINVYYGCYLHVLSATFLLCYTQVLAALPHLQKVTEVCHSEQFSFPNHIHDFRDDFFVRGIQCCVIACQYPIIGWRNLPYNEWFANGLASGFWMPWAGTIMSNGSNGLHWENMSYGRDYFVYHIQEIGVLWVRRLLLAPPVSYVQFPKCTATLHWVRVVIIEICLNVRPVVW